MLNHIALTIQRIEQFTHRFQRYIYPEKVPMKVEVAGPVGRISYEKARKLTYRPLQNKLIMKPLWATYWFKLAGMASTAWANRPVDLLFHGKSEALLWIHGKPAQGLNYEEPFLFSDGGRIEARLPQKIIRRGKIDLEVEAACNGLSGSQGDDHYAFTGAELALFDQEAWDLFHDLLVPTQYLRSLVRENRPGQSWLGHHVSGNLSAWEGYLLQKLNEICNIADPEDRSTWKSIRPLIREVYSHRNASVAHELSAIGHAHIDTAWLWPIAETKRKCARTFSTALSYMQRYPNYKFSCSQAQQYQWMKEEFPSIYKDIKAAVKRGQWIPVGGSWIEPDCNLPSGESLVRQFLYGKKFFREEFDWDCREFWNPDVFGYSGALPQILKKSGIDYFLTQKLAWNQFNKPRHQNFLWRGIDGSQVLTHFPPAENYNAMSGTAVVLDLLLHERQMMDHHCTNEGLLLYGYGDGGGGPTLHMLEVLERVGDFQGFPKTRQRTSLEFYRRLENSLSSPPVIEGELYLELHRGTYTTHAANKFGNRRSEILLRAVEMLAVIGLQVTGKKYPSAKLERLWKITLLNQFHDILPGTSIREVHEESSRNYDTILRDGSQLAQQAAESLVTERDSGICLFNACGWERHGLVEIDSAAVNGTQPSWKGTFLADALIPSCGVAPLKDTVSPTEAASAHKITGGFILENTFIRAEFSAGGLLSYLRDKRTARDVIGRLEPANRFVLFDDHPIAFEAWDVDIMHLEKKESVPPAVHGRLLETGPLRAGLEFIYRFDKSSIIQRVFLSHIDAHLEFDCDVDWQHRRRFLKVEFPVEVRASDAAFEIQFGHVKRPTHFSDSQDMARFEVSAHKWIDLSEPGYGAALFTDSKYGYAVHGSTMRISLLRGVAEPDANTDVGKHSFRFAFFPHAESLHEAQVVRRAYEFNTPWIQIPGRVDPQSWFSVDSPHLVIDTIKKAEDSDAVVVRLYESHGARGQAYLAARLHYKKAVLTNLLEEPLKVLPIQAGKVYLTFRPFEIITILLSSYEDFKKSNDRP